jgi:hypothetical protein
MEKVSPEEQPVKVIEFIKKWVANEKMLINHFLQTLLLSESIVQQSFEI